MLKALAIAKGKIMRGDVARIGQLIHARNAAVWETRLQKTPGFLHRRVEDPRRWRLVDAFNLADLLDIEPERIETLVNAEIAYRETGGINSAGGSSRATARA